MFALVLNDHLEGDRRFYEQWLVFTFGLRLVLISFLLLSQVSGRAAWFTGRQTQWAVFLWPLPIRCSEEINVRWIMLSAACQEDGEQLSKTSVSGAFSSACVPMPEANSPAECKSALQSPYCYAIQDSILKINRLTPFYEPLSISVCFW